jgi:hypothetical protein
MGRFDYVKFDDSTAEKLSDFKDRFIGLEKCCSQLKDGRAKSLVLTKLEEAYMWVGKALRDEQIALGGDSTDQPNRTNI